MPAVKSSGLVDGLGRRVDYLRVSMTDRCNFRCAYCMPLQSEFMPRSSLLSLEDMYRLCSAFIARGTRKIRLTGGEPLVRRGIVTFVEQLARHLDSGALDEITLTTNGWLLARHASALHAAGVRRINVSLDTLDAARFHAITRTGRLGVVLDGIEAALAAGLKVKINTVAMAGVNDDEFSALVGYAHRRGMDITFIELMPLGDVDLDRAGTYLPIGAVERLLEQDFVLRPSAWRTAGPARYFDVVDSHGRIGGRIGLINPMSHSFCEGCDKVRLSSAGVLYTCLGHDNEYDLAEILHGTRDQHALNRAIDDALRAKPPAHRFNPAALAKPALRRSMSVLGG